MVLQQQSDVITFESMSTSFWLDPSTLMLPLFQLLRPPLAFTPSLHSLSTASPLLAGAVNPLSCVTPAPLHQLLEGAAGMPEGGSGIWIRSPRHCCRHFSEQLPRPRQEAFLDSLPEPLRLFPRLRGSGVSYCGSMPGRPDLRCLELGAHTASRHTLTLWQGKPHAG